MEDMMKYLSLFIFFIVLLFSFSYGNVGFVNGFENYQPPKAVSSPVKINEIIVDQELNYPYDWGRDVLIDTSVLYDFDGDYDENTGQMWVVTAPRYDSVIRLYYSTDHGYHWTWARTISHTLKSLYKKVRIIVGRGDSNYIYIFGLHSGLNNTGDIFVLAYTFDLSRSVHNWVTWNNDTINDFAVAKDFRNNYWLYCVAANENRGGFNAKLFRSSDCGRTWDSQIGFDIGDPDIIFGTGPNLNFAFVRFSRDTLCYQRNNNYGAPGNWQTLAVLDGITDYKYCPKVSPAFTSPDSIATTWVLYELDWHNTGDLDIWYAVRSHAWGDTWRKRYLLAGSTRLDERVPDIEYYKSIGNIWVNASYIIYDSSYNETSYVYSRWSDANNPFNWHDTNKVNDSGTQVGTWFGPKTCGPKIVYSPGAPAPGGGVLYTRATTFYIPYRLYFDAPWFPSAIEKEKEYKSKILKINTLAKKAILFQFKTEIKKAAIYNLEGRLVKSFNNQASSLLWNGKDDYGKDVPIGVYLIKFKTDKKEFTEKFIFLR
uniref:T9SS type A sorting domain-containing protein n=1 Tax=candidate division WOR-3 bacterium TaxID=2052148 RepID=A0A7V3ZWD9_UNCW3